jgi:tyrosine-specific transport protein
MATNYGNVTRGALLVAGTAIGGGMLALPVLTSQAGFFPSLLIYFGCWLFMTFTGLLFLEVSLWMGNESNIISMAEKTLGTKGKVAAWGLYLFLFYCLTLAYIVGAGDLIVELFHHSIAEWQGQLIFLAIFGPFVYAGAHVVGRLNLFLMLGLGISYLAFVVLGYRYVEMDLLLTRRWSFLLAALPITFTAFAYQGIIPTLVNYMEKDMHKTRLAIIIGSFLPFLTYVIWQWLILGIVPAHGPESLAEAMANGQNAVQPLKNFLATPSVYIVGQYFAFFALITSFFGVTLGLLDFLADGMRITKTPQNKLLLCLLIFAPPFFFAMIHPHVFLTALDYAGGFGCALLLGLLPVLMVWRGRYHLKWRSNYELWGGRPLLVGLFAFVMFELVCEVAIILGKL